MGLKDRLDALQEGVPTSSLSPADRAATEPTNPIVQLRTRAQDALFTRLGGRLYESSLTETELRSFVNEEVESLLQVEPIPLNEDERERLIGDITAEVVGLGPLEVLLNDDSVTEIMVLGERPIYVERSGQIEKLRTSFTSEAHLRRTIERIVSRVGRRIDESTPMVDARLLDGSRVNAVIPPLAVDGSMLTIRKFAAIPLTVEQLIANKTFSRQTADLLKACVEGRISCLISGGTGTGKTTMLNVLSQWISDKERIVTIEDAVELKLRQAHVARLESRPPNIEGAGEVSIRDLVRNSLRMRPDRIIVGEVRGGEALDMLQAMNTGHEGSLTTLHANSPRDALARLETMVLMAGMDLPHRAIREQIASAIDVVLQIGRLSDGTRRITSITEVTGMEGDVIQMSELFSFDWNAGRDASGSFAGDMVTTGVRPGFERRLRDVGIELTPDLFGSPSDLAAAALRRRP